MKTRKTVKYQGLLGVLLLLAVFAGCEESAQVDDGTQLAEVEAEKIFYPGAPEIPRIQFLTSISSEKDIAKGEVVKKKLSAFESFIVGEEQEKKDFIAKPYGMDIYQGRLYVCDVSKRLVEMIDLNDGTFGYLTKETRMSNPMNIFIDDLGRKYITDSTGGAVFVFGKDDKLKSILGRSLGIKPVDISVVNNKCYIADMNSNQIVVIDRLTGEELNRIGVAGSGEGQFAMIGGVATDEEGNIYATDKGLGKMVKFNSEGIFQMSVGEPGTGVNNFVRPKGISLDKEGRIYIIDAAPEMAKLYNSEGQLLMFFGGAGGAPGDMSLPTSIRIDYDNIDLFEEYFDEGAKVEYLIFVANQYGPKINVYGFGEFPIEDEKRREERLKSVEDGGFEELDG